MTVKCEKQQAAAIADYLRKVMSDLPSPVEQPLPAAMELAEPVDPVFVLGPIGLGYDRDNDRVLVQLEEVVPVDEEGEPDPDAVEDRGHLPRVPDPRAGRGAVQSYRVGRRCRSTSVPVVR